MQADDERTGYAACGEIAGPPIDGPADILAFRRTVVGSRRGVLYALVCANIATEFVFLAWLFAPVHWSEALGEGGIAGALDLAVFGAIAVVEAIRLLQTVSLCTFSLTAHDPVPMRPPRGLRVAVLTTIVPSREPIDLVAATLAAMRRIEYEDGAVDVWILDEDDDPKVRQVAKHLGVRHFSRRFIPSFNTCSGPFRARTKSGNHNAWLATHGDAYDVVAQLDPDHVPLPHFLQRTLGYFRDPDVAFVVAPQVYGRRAGMIAHGAAAQAYVFHGTIQRGGNGLGAPLLIGTNHVYRTAAWRQIGGYQDSIIEDHLTSMTVQGTVNPGTQQRWKGVYTPDIVAVGQAPTTWGDFFRQQRRWAYGVSEIVQHHSWRLGRRLTARQRLAYAFLQSFYPGVALTWIVGTLITLAYLLHAAHPPHIGAFWPILWGVSWIAAITLFLWTRRLNLAAHEREELGALGALATLCAGPVYAAAVVSAALNRPLAYDVTPKGSASLPDRPATFRLHFAWVVVLGTAVVASVPLNGGLVPRLWALAALAASATPPASHLLVGLRSHRSAKSLAKPSSVRDP